MDKTRDFHVRPNCSGMTLYHFLKRVLPRNRLAGLVNLIRDGSVQVNGTVAGAEQRLTAETMCP